MSSESPEVLSPTPVPDWPPLRRCYAQRALERCGPQSARMHVSPDVPAGFAPNHVERLTSARELCPTRSRSLRSRAPSEACTSWSPDRSLNTRLGRSLVRLGGIEANQARDARRCKRFPDSLGPAGRHYWIQRTSSNLPRRRGEASRPAKPEHFVRGDCPAALGARMLLGLESEIAQPDGASFPPPRPAYWPMPKTMPKTRGRFREQRTPPCAGRPMRRARGQQV